MATEIHKTLWTVGTLRCVLVTQPEPPTYQIDVWDVWDGTRSVWTGSARDLEDVASVANWLWRRFGKGTRAPQGVKPMRADREPCYSPTAKPPPPQLPNPGELIWTLHKDYVRWSCELRFCGEAVGSEAQILRNGDVVIARTFRLRETAVRWAESERRDIELGWLD